MSHPVDVVIPAAPKDYNKLPYVIEAVREYVKAETVHVFAPYPVGLTWAEDVILHYDEDVLPYDRRELPYRPNWTFQQMLKLFQDVTKHDWYLVLDADIVVNCPLPLWTGDGKPILYLGRDQNHGPYFTFNERLLGFGKVYDHSFLSECTLYNKGLVRDMLTFCGLGQDGFWQKLVEIVDVGCCLAESELYGSYVTHECPDLYDIQHIKSRLGGKYGAHIWTDEEIQKELREAGEEDCLISLHSWEGGI